ncbi:MAG: RNA methyltransferase [Rikenellaceae bacterium]
MFSKAKISYINSLNDKKHRNKHNVFIVEGEKMSEDVLKSTYKIEEIFYTDKLSERINLHEVNCEKICIDFSQMKKISQLKTPSTILMIVKIPEILNPEIQNYELTIVLDGVQDPGNLGTIIRVADWFGVKNIFCSEDSADVFNPKVVQATMGAITRVNVSYCKLTELLKNTKLPIFGTFLDGENIYSKDLPECGVIIMGNEGKGVSKDVEKLVTEKLYIPPFPANAECVESLNVSIATAITLSQFRGKLSNGR